jgi:hypothetical protein
MAITCSNQDRVNAARRGKDVFACGMVEAKGKGRFEFTGPMEWRLADALVGFCHMVYSGKSPADAFAAISWPTAEVAPSEGVEAAAGNQESTS